MPGREVEREGGEGEGEKGERKGDFVIGHSCDHAAQASFRQLCTPEQTLRLIRLTDGRSDSKRTSERAQGLS